MKRIYEISGTQTREAANLIVNNTGLNQDPYLYFVQLDDDFAVDNKGAIFQIVDKDSAKDVAENSNALQYEGESGNIYNYAEDRPDFAEDSEDLDIYSDCKEQAELLADDYILGIHSPCNVIDIKEKGIVRVNGDIANYGNLLQHLNLVGEFKTNDSGTIVLFEYGNKFIEYLLDSCFASGESANFTDLTFEEIMDYYKIQ